MSGAALPWLPPPRDGDVERAVAVFLAPWAATWFAAPGAVRVKPHPGRSDRDLRWTGAAGAAAGMAPAALARLGLALVGGEAEGDDPADRAVLERLAGAALADLGARLEVASGGAASETAGGDLLDPAGAPPAANLVLRACLGDHDWAVLLSLGASAQVALRKAAAGQGRRPVLARLAEALAPEPVRIGCHLGSAALSAGELAGLGAGDLVAFDRFLTDALPLVVAGEPAASGTARVVRDGEDVVVRIAQGIDFP